LTVAAPDLLLMFSSFFLNCWLDIGNTTVKNLPKLDLKLFDSIDEPFAIAGN